MFYFCRWNLINICCVFFLFLFNTCVGEDRVILFAKQNRDLICKGGSSLSSPLLRANVNQSLDRFWEV